MRAVVLEEPGRLRAVEIPEPGEPPAGWALVRVRAVGVCGTDLHAFAGNQPFFAYPRVLGHELGVEIVSVNDPMSGLPVGAMCAVRPYLECGVCGACRQGKPNCCEALRVMGVHMDGGMAELLHVPVDHLYDGEGLRFEQLALIETLAIGRHAVSRSGIRQGDRALVIGAGPIGLSVAISAQAVGAEVGVHDRSEGRLAFAGGISGVRAVTDVADFGAQVVFDATGSASSMQASFGIPLHGGKLVFVGLVQSEIRFDDASFHARELTLLATRNALPEDFAALIPEVRAGTLRTEGWVNRRAKLEEAQERFAEWVNPASGCLKAMIEI